MEHRKKHTYAERYLYRHGDSRKELARQGITLLAMLAILPIFVFGLSGIQPEKTGGQALLQDRSGSSLESGAIETPGSLADPSLTDPVPSSHYDDSRYCRDADPECADDPSEGCDVRDEDFILTQDYEFANGINVCKSNRIVDCQGHRLLGTDESGHTGILIHNNENLVYGVTIRNCVIEGYKRGIWDYTFLQQTGGHEIYDNTLIGNVLGIYIRDSINNFIHDNTIIAGRTMAGIVGTGGIDLSGRVQQNRVYRNTITGSYAGVTLVHIRAGANEIIGNTIEDNENGMWLEFGRGLGNVVANNQINRNQQAGIRIRGFSNAQIYGNTMDANAVGILLLATRWGSGFEVESSANTIQSNTITGTGSGTGIRITTDWWDTLENNGKVRNNRISQNTISGMDVGIEMGELFPTQVIAGNAIEENTLTGNRVGMLLDRGPTESTSIARNTINQNYDYGIRMVEFSGALLDENTACYNLRSDISAESSSNTGDNNRCSTADNWNDDGTTGCTFVCDPLPTICGNEIVEWGEQCDDGNTNPSDGCDNCQLCGGYQQDCCSSGELNSCSGGGLYCSSGQYSVGGSCICPISAPWNPDTQRCECPEGTTLDPQMHECIPYRQSTPICEGCVAE